MSFWNKKIFSLEDAYFGMDLNDFSVKVFELDKNGNLDVIRSFNSERIREGLIENGKIIDKEKVSEIIKIAIANAGPKKINTNKVICSIPESKVFMRTISIPEVSEKEAGEAIKWELEASIPLTVDQVYFDWQFLGKNGGKQEVLTAAVSREFADDITQILEKSGLSVYGLEVESLALVRSLLSNSTKKEETNFIVDLGGENTSFAIAEGTIPYFTSSIPFSSVGITESISNLLGIGDDEAERIKIIHGIENTEENNSIFNSIKPLLENLSVEIERTIDFYQSISKNKSEIKKIIISGGGAGLRGLIPYFTTRLAREVVVGNPWVNLNFGKNLPVISRAESSRYATAIGLAMWGKKYEDKA